MMASAIVAADPAATDPAEKGGDEAAMNPYQAKPGLTPSQLVMFLQKMLDRPQVIQTRPGFADAVVEACDRVLAAEPAASESEQLVAIETKFAVLHREACDGKASADKQLIAFVEQRKDDRRPAIAREVEFFRLERRVLDAKELPIEEIPDVLKEVKSYAAKERLTAKHLRLASSTVGRDQPSGRGRRARSAVRGLRRPVREKRRQRTGSIW